MTIAADAQPGERAPTGAAPTAAAPAGPRPLVLRSSEFRRGREAGWRELDDLISRIERHGVGALSPMELERLPLLYRATLSSLSVARGIALDRALLAYLENLCLRAFLTVYAPRQGLAAGLGHFFHFRLPSAVRAARWHLLVAALAMAAGLMVGYLLTAADEAWMATLVPGDMSGGRGPQSSREDLLANEIFAPWPGFAQSFVVFANFLFQHNTMVGILAFSLGIAAGLPTLLLMAYQGLVLGAMLALHANRGLTVEFLGWISIHGVTEIAAILLCGAGGLVIAEKVLFPGRYGRLANLALHGRQAAAIATGCVLMFLVAGLIEGGLRQLVQPTALRFAIGGLTGLAWLAYFVLAGRRERPR